MNAIASKGVNSRTAQDYADVAMMLPPEQSKAVLESWNAVDKGRQNESLGVAGRVMALDSAGRPETASAILNAHASKLKSEGNDAEAAYWLEMTKADPNKRNLALGTTMSLTPEGSKLLETLQSINEKRINNTTLEDRNQLGMRKTEAEIAKMKGEATKLVKDTAMTSASERVQNVKRNVELADINKQISIVDKLLDDAELGSIKTKSPEWAQVVGQTARQVTGIGASGPAEKFKQSYRILREKAKTSMFKGQGAISNAERDAFDKIYPTENAPTDLIKASLEAMKKQYLLDKAGLEAVTPNPMGSSNVVGSPSAPSAPSGTSKARPTIFQF
jgi:hypothetical protein